METTAHWLTLAFAKLVAFLPSLIAGLVVLLVGYIIGVLLAKATRALAHRLGFDRFIARLGLGEPKGESTASNALGRLVFFFVIVATIMQTARVWDLTFVAAGLARFLVYVPHVLAACVVFAVALFLGNWVRDRLMRGAVEGEDRRVRIRVLPSAVRAGIIALGSFMALRELQIAPKSSTLHSFSSSPPPQSQLRLRSDSALETSPDAWPSPGTIAVGFTADSPATSRCPPWSDNPRNQRRARRGGRSVRPVEEAAVHISVGVRRAAWCVT